MTRAWNAFHGGVYVPVTEETQPNPYLENSLRDITTTNGTKLTMINPAFMTRQIAELSSFQHDINFHITSLNPIRPANKPTLWEANALRSFEDGTEEILILDKQDTNAMYRYMAPLVTTQNCLQCHAKQGYQVGDIRGGISISFPATLFINNMNRGILLLYLSHFMVLVLGILAILYIGKINRKFYTLIENKNIALKHKQEILEESNQQLQQTNATKNKLFSIIAHDLRSPYNALIGFSDILKNEYDELSEQERKK